jgi:alkylated DNA repair dioxygenase AlkB
MSVISADIVWQTFELVGADVRVAQFCDAAAARRWFDRLHAEIPWERHRLLLFGRQIEAPRLSCWIGDDDAVYTYSGTRFVPHAWTAACTELRERLRELCGEPFNSALANLYRDGSDSMGWHSDKEPELGARPCIASLSFGASRRFRLRHRRDPLQRIELELASGSLLLMSGATQRNYRHDLPKAASVTAPRLNLTFRRVLAIVPDREDHKAPIRGRTGADAIVRDREGQEAAIRGRTGADAIVRDREDHKAAIRGRTSQKSNDPTK